jgi:hypothetical protein
VGNRGALLLRRSLDRGQRVQPRRAQANAHDILLVHPELRCLPASPAWRRSRESRRVDHDRLDPLVAIDDELRHLADTGAFDITGFLADRVDGIELVLGDRLGRDLLSMNDRASQEKNDRQEDDRSAHATSSLPVRVGP